MVEEYQETKTNLHNYSVERCFREVLLDQEDYDRKIGEINKKDNDV